MKNLIAISTGLIYKFTNSRDEMVEIIREFNPDGIEFHLADPQYVFDFTLNSKNLSYVKSLKRLSIHAPWIDMKYDQCSTISKLLSRLEEINRLLTSQNITFEIDTITDFSVFDNFQPIASIENADWRNQFHDPLQIKNILSQYKKWQFTFDFAHALALDDDVIPEFLEMKNRISQIHLSYLDRQSTEHRFLHQCNQEILDPIIQKLKLIPADIPLVLECVAATQSEISLIRNEIEFLKTL